MRVLAVLFPALALLASGQPLAAQDYAGNTYADYVKKNGLSGTLSSVGSDTLENLTILWAEQFKRHYPKVEIRIQAAGSSTAPPALNAGTANIGPMSRRMEDSEVALFENVFGYKPTPVVIAIDTLAVYVHKDNPVSGLTLQDLDAIFSANRKCGAGQAIDSWGDLSLAGDWRNLKIELYGRNSISGTHSYFMQHALCNGAFRNTVVEKPGSASLVHSIAATPAAIGYSGIGYSTTAVRTVPLASDAGKPFVEATPENALSGSYPLARLLYVYVNRAPEQPLEPVALQFLAMALSADGQKMVSRAGYIPLPVNVARRELLKLQ